MLKNMTFLGFYESQIQNPSGLPFGIILKFIEKSVVDILKDKV